MIRHRPSYTSLFISLVLIPLAGTASAAELSLAWDPSPTADVIGYLLSWGTRSGVYDNSLDVGNRTAQLVQGLADGTNYYFVVQAYNTTHTMSGFSNEVPGQTPTSQPSPLSITCSAPTISSPNGAPVPVSFSPAVAGGTPPVTTTCVPPSGSLFSVGTTSYTCTAVDAINRTASCSSVIVVSGPPPSPTISCPSPTATSSNSSGVPVTFAPTVSDGLQPLNVGCTPPSGSIFPVGTTSLSCTVVDALSRSASCQTSVVVSGPTPKKHGRRPR